MNIETGGPAFPVNELHTQTGDVCDQNFGMTLRDYFAAKALATDCASTSSPPQRAAWAYSIADAMLAERAKAQTAQDGV